MPVIAHRTSSYIVGVGAFADVLLWDTSTVVKVFRREEMSHDSIEDFADHDILIRAIWDAECAAYELLLNHPHLARYTPQYFGRIQFTDVLGPTGESLGERYVLDCAYRIQRVPGIDVKIGHLDGQIATRVNAYLDSLDNVGICHTGDSSAFIPGIDTEFTLIDFATWDALTELSEQLSVYGRLNDSVRSRWSRRRSG